MNTFKRIGNKWSVNELLQLQREYELLEWSVQKIADKHQRTVNAIMFRLEDEGFINSWSEARGFKIGSDCDIEEKNDNAVVEEAADGDDNNSECVCGDNWNECDDNSSLCDDVEDDNTITSSDRLNERLDAIEETLANIKEIMATILANTQQKNSNPPNLDLNFRRDLPNPNAMCKPWV